MARPTSQSNSPIQPKSPGWINEFLWTCAGVNKQILRQCPADYAKYAGIGGTILFTALMACLSGGYALNYVFEDPWIGLLFGCFWGLLIFNLDRFIVNTMYSDGKHTISWGEIKSGLPRIIMAIFLGLVISTPLEMKIFSDQIDYQLGLDNDKRKKDASKSIQVLYNELNKYESNKAALDSEKKRLEEKLEKAKIDVRDEAVGRGDGKAGHGMFYNDKLKYQDYCESKLSNWEATKKSDIERLNNDIDRVKQKIAKKEKEINQNTEKNGFIGRYEAFENVTSWKDHPALALVALMITLLFVIIETAPTFLKMMMEDGPYDDMLRAEKHRFSVMADKSISDLNDEVNTAVRISTMKNEKRLEAETIANQDVLEKIAHAQAELLETAIAGWKERELEKIRQNPENYVVSLVPPRQEIEVVADATGNIREVTEEDRRVSVTTTDIIPIDNDLVDKS